MLHLFHNLGNEEDSVIACCVISFTKGWDEFIDPQIATAFADAYKFVL
jgi:hypothetical protein